MAAVHAIFNEGGCQCANRIHDLYACFVSSFSMVDSCCQLDQEIGRIRQKNKIPLVVKIRSWKS
jgi:hypothetical protein